MIVWILDLSEPWCAMPKCCHRLATADESWARELHEKWGLTTPVRLGNSGPGLPMTSRPEAKRGLKRRAQRCDVTAE